ncbi:WbqC-like protein [Janthinobacterium sp. 61]|uniref:WbqC family protein n=1 Tax=Janthinobacterium sp. 61 TaxID=2035209 RepID=UPI000C700085|nr:WbqC family protein [Janthinobacterium sp. 61]PKV43511.1 WbqC-like protein [Janthinobacterium sp. 61]
MTTIAVMQPYFLPYLGYFQLIAAVEKFVVLDDAAYMKQGWINRNRILLNGAPHLFTVPVNGASPHRRICDLQVATQPAWRDKLLSSVHHAYARAPHYRTAAALLERIVHFSSTQLDAFLLNSLRETMDYLSLDTELVPTSRKYGNSAMHGEERVLDICRQEGASRYLNAVGGMLLYQHETFRQHKIQLQFLTMQKTCYPQGKHEHVGMLSILDVIMYNCPDTTHSLLRNGYSLS